MARKDLRKRNFKKSNIQKHFAMRCIERIGVVLDEKELVKKIQNQELEFLDRQSNRVTVFRYIFNNKKYRLLYDSLRKTVITILYEREV